MRYPPYGPNLLSQWCRCPYPPSPYFLEDELIRQVTINCAERGLLLLRVRDEIHMTIAAYQTMYESSIAFGMRKALIAEQRKAEMEAKVWKHDAYCYRCAPCSVCVCFGWNRYIQ